MILRAEYLQAVEPYLGTPIIKILTGLRRVGKSTILLQLRELLQGRGVAVDDILYINMELLSFSSIRTCHDLDSYIHEHFQGRTNRRYILVDEVQEIQEWERAVASILAEGNCDIILTGSNAHLLSSELATLLTGRYIAIKVFPLGFNEFCRFRIAAGSTADSRVHFKEYLRYGGLPGIHVLPMTDAAVFPYIAAVGSDILLKDVVKRHRIRDVSVLERIAQFAYDSCGSPVSAKSIAAYFKSQHTHVSIDTVISYLEYLCEAFIFHRVSRFDIRGKRHLEYISKFFAGDIGLRNAAVGWADRDISGLLENCVYLELCRRGYEVSIGMIGDREIDFVATKGALVEYYQVAYLIADEQTREREFGNLEAVSDQYGKTVLSLDDYAMQGRNGIAWMHAREWMESVPPVQKG